MELYGVNPVTPSNTSTQFPLVRGFDGVITGDGGTSGFATNLLMVLVMGYYISFRRFS